MAIEVVMFLGGLIGVETGNSMIIVGTSLQRQIGLSSTP
jgi:hypothetical protein